MSYTTKEDVALFLNRDIDELSVMELAQIELLLPYADGLINNYTGWNMLSTDYVDKRYDGNGTNTLDLRLNPVNTVTQIRIRETDGTFTDVTAGVEILEGGVIQFLPYATTSVVLFTAGVKNIFVTFNAGYVVIPNELAYAANYLVALHYNKVIDENIGSDDEKFEGVTFKNTDMVLPKPVSHLLDRFRLISVF
jgi:hypothetical protein